MNYSDRVALAVTGRTPRSAVVAARGRVTPATAAELRNGLVKLLTDGVPVLLGVADLRLDWAPSPEVFVNAVTAAGGWPLARLVLFGADAHTTERLRACRVPESVHLADTMDDAAALVDVRPACLSCGVDLPPDPQAVLLGREVLRNACDRWGVAHPDDALIVVGELVGNAVRHAGTPIRLRLVLDHTGLRVSVRDRLPGPLPQPAEVHATHGGLRTVARLSRTWGVLLHGDGKAVWAQLPLCRRNGVGRHGLGRNGVGRGHVGRGGTALDPARTRPSRAVRAPVASSSVTAPDHRRLTTADAEYAHAFLRTVFGEHTLRISGAADSDFHLEYDGVTTNRFAVERIGHGGAVEGLFHGADALVVVRQLHGELAVTCGRTRLRAGPGDLVLCGPGNLRIESRRSDVEVVRLAPATVARIAAELTDFVGTSLPFDGTRPVSPARAALWRATVAHLRRDVLGNEEVMASPLSRATVLRSLVALLVETFPNPALDALGGGSAERAPVTPRTVSRAVAFIEERAGDDIGLADIAAAAGLGARGLQLAFRRHADVTPLEYLRRVRLARAHRELQEAEPSQTTVGAVAHRWGFPHHGNFSALYLRTYGRSPSITLRS